MFCNDTPREKTSKGETSMNYFYAVHAQANKNDEVRFFIPITADSEENIPSLTSEKIWEQETYILFAKKKSVKKVFVDYNVYKTDVDTSGIFANDFDSFYNSLLSNDKATRITGAEIEMSANIKDEKKKKKKKKSAKTNYPLVICLVMLGLAAGVMGGWYLNIHLNKVDEIIVEAEPVMLEVDGMILPDTLPFDPKAQYIIVSIDQSYSAIPKEDIQLRGEVEGNSARITLPSFDRTDFFNHVPGHTWGFTSDPNSTKIEYYGGVAYNFEENVKLYRVLVKYGGGNGTKEDPYLIDYFDQINLMAEEDIRGYFKQISDIRFPEWASNQSIYTINELNLVPELEYFEYDGGGFTIEGLTAPLFRKVSGSVIKNVNIINSSINTSYYSNYGFIVSEAYNYRYEVDGETYETGETLIINSSVTNSAINIRPRVLSAEEIEQAEAEQIVIVPPVIPPGIEPPPNFEPTPFSPTTSAEYALGGITGLGGQIENCYVTNVGIFSYIDDYYLYAGGISGKPVNVINSGVYHLSIRGNIFNAGGIAGSAGGSRLYSAVGSELPIFYGGNIQGCSVRRFSASVENAAGGITGESSTNAEGAIISNCYAASLDFSVGVFEDTQRTKVIRSGLMGGIIGSDGVEDYGHLLTNSVSQSGFSVIGVVRRSQYDDTVRLAPIYAFRQEGLLSVINRNTVHPDNPGVIFTGNFVFAEDERNSDEFGKYPFPKEISELLPKSED